MLPVWLTDTVTSDLDRALHYTLLWGLEGVELRTVGGAGDRVPYVNEAKLRRRLVESELPVAAIVPGLFEGAASDRAAWLNEVVTFEETLQFCRRIGCARVVVSGFGAEEASGSDLAAEALRRVGEMAARQGVVVAVLNERDGARPTGAALAALLQAVEHPAVQAAWSPAAARAAGEDPAEGLAQLEGRVALVRCRDGRLAEGLWEPCPLGEGDVGWPGQLRALQAAGFAGPVSLEVEVEPRPKRGLQEATRLIQMLRAARAS